MLRTDVQDQMKQAMRDKDTIRLAALRFLWSEIRNAEIDAKGELNDEDVQKVVMREVKKRKEEIEQITKAGRDPQEEIEKLAVLETFLPEMMDKEAIEAIVDEILAGGATDMGPVMGQTMAKIKATGQQVDGKLVQEVVKAKLN